MNRFVHCNSQSVAKLGSGSTKSAPPICRGFAVELQVTMGHSFRCCALLRLGWTLMTIANFIWGVFASQSGKQSGSKVDYLAVD